MELVGQISSSLRDRLLAVSFWKRREFFKRWNDLHTSEEAYLPLEKKIRRILETFSPLPLVNLPRRIRFVSIVDQGYPLSFLELPQPPLGIYIQGSWDEGQTFMAMVGSRKPTPYARRMTRQCARVWVEVGATIVSGGAMGIDGEAHSAALEFGGRTIVVMGGGHSHWYPKSHQRLFESILESGGTLLSEYPPYSEPRPYTFPERNRLIAALGEGLFLAQAHSRSGSLSTARTALDLGRDIWVLKPVLGDENYSGSQELIEMGAHTLFGPQDLVCSPSTPPREE